MPETPKPSESLPEPEESQKESAPVLSSEEMERIDEAARLAQESEPKNPQELAEKIEQIKEGMKEKLTKEEIISLGNELYESGEIFPFPGMNPEAYAELKAGDAEYPGFVTPIDEIVERLAKEGMKVVPEQRRNGQFYILPAGSNDIRNDSISPRHLAMNEAMPENLKKLILAFKK